MAKKEEKKEVVKGRLEKQREAWKKDQPLSLSDRLIKSQAESTLEKLQSGKLSSEDADKANKYLDQLSKEAKERKLKVKLKEQEAPKAE